MWTYMHIHIFKGNYMDINIANIYPRAGHMMRLLSRCHMCACKYTYIYEYIYIYINIIICTCIYTHIDIDVDIHIDIAHVYKTYI